MDNEHFLVSNVEEETDAGARYRQEGERDADGGTNDRSNVGGAEIIV